MTPACPYCLTELEPGGGDVVSCPECGTPTHKECWDENGGCTVFGCSQAPSDEPKVTVAAGDLEPVEPAAVPTAAAPVVGQRAGLEAGLEEAPDGASPIPPPFVGGFPPPPPFPDGRPEPPPFPGGAPPPPGPPGFVVPPAFANGAPPAPPAEPSPMSVGGALSITAPPPGAPASMYSLPKERVTFILLGILLGAFGAHNFYAGYASRGGFQVALTFLSCFFLIPFTWLWAIVEVSVVSRDAEDRLMT